MTVKIAEMLCGRLPINWSTSVLAERYSVAFYPKGAVIGFRHRVAVSEGLKSGT